MSFNYFFTPIGSEYKKKFARNFGIAILILLTFYGIWTIFMNKDQPFPYEADYDDLIVRNVGMAVYKTVETHPDQNCFSLSSSMLESFPDDFLDNLKSASEEEYHDTPQIYPPGVYTGYGMSTKKETALELLSHYRFNETKTVFSDNISRFPDAQYDFDCFFEHENNQYLLRLTFQNQITDGNYVNVNFTKNSGFPYIENPNITVFDGGFNSTVLFRNNLDEDVVLYSYDPAINLIDADDGDVHENRFVKTLQESETIIPPGKFFSYHFTTFQDKYDEPITYTVKPFNLQGSVTVKPYPRCMTETEVKSLYNSVSVYPKFPTYLPDGYSFECGVHNTNAFVHLVYFTDELRAKFSDNVNTAFNQEFFASGGLVIDYYDEAWNGWIEDPNYDKFEKASENSKHPWATQLTILDQPVVLVNEISYHDGQKISFNRLEIFLDEEQIRIKSSLSQEELVKIAESMIKNDDYPFGHTGPMISQETCNDFVISQWQPRVEDREKVQQILEICIQRGFLTQDLVTRGKIADNFTMGPIQSAQTLTGGDIEKTIEILEEMMKNEN